MIQKNKLKEKMHIEGCDEKVEINRILSIERAVGQPRLELSGFVGLGRQDGGTFNFE